MPKVVLLIVQASLETPPPEIMFHPEIVQYAKRKGRKPKYVILDKSYHYNAIKRLKNSEKRGRPDIVHFCLLEALGSPLNKEGMLEVLVHTIGGYLMRVDPKVRLPKNYNRFIGLMEQLFMYGKVPPREQPLLVLEQKSLDQILKEDVVEPLLLLSERGEHMKYTDVVSLLRGLESVTIALGGFPHGELPEVLYDRSKYNISLYKDSLEAWTALSRALTLCEIAYLDS